MNECDAVVIGGGLAGSAAALLLAHAGKHVIVLEKEHVAHHKVCGEFLSFEAQYYLAALGIDLDALGAVPIGRVRLVAGARSVDCPLPFRGVSLSRKRLDEHLLIIAENHGVEVKRGYNVNTLAQYNKKWHIGIADKKEKIIAETVFLATGKHDLHNVPRGQGDQNNFIAFKMHFTLVDHQMQALGGHVEIFFFQGGYAGLELVEEGRANLCLVVKKDYFNTCGKRWNLLLAAIMAATPLLAERLKDAQPSWAQPLAIFKIPYGFVYDDSSPAMDGLYRLGDQMAVIPSFCGDGMSIAFYTSFQATQSYLKADAEFYHRNARKILLPQIRFASLLARMSSYSCMQNLLIMLGKIAPSILSQLANRTRIRNYNTIKM